MDPTLAVALVALVGTMVTAVMMYRASTKATDANAQVQWVQQLRADATDARKEAHSARQEAAVARRQLAATEERADDLEDRLRHMEPRVRAVEARVSFIVASIHDPSMSLDRLRALVPADDSRAGAG